MIAPARAAAYDILRRVTTGHSDLPTAIARVRDALADACANKVEPPCRVPIEIETLEGALVVRLDVPELDPVEKPCFVRTRGAYGGSFIRGGDGDRPVDAGAHRLPGYFAARYACSPPRALSNG